MKTSRFKRRRTFERDHQDVEVAVVIVDVEVVVDELRTSVVGEGVETAHQSVVVVGLVESGEEVDELTEEEDSEGEIVVEVSGDQPVVVVVESVVVAGALSTKEEAEVELASEES